MLAYQQHSLATSVASTWRSLICVDIAVQHAACTAFARPSDKHTLVVDRVLQNQGLWRSAMAKSTL